VLIVLAGTRTLPMGRWTLTPEMGRGALTVGRGRGTLTVGIGGSGALTVGMGRGTFTVDIGRGTFTVDMGRDTLTAGMGRDTVTVGTLRLTLGSGTRDGKVRAGAGLGRGEKREGGEGAAVPVGRCTALLTAPDTRGWISATICVTSSECEFKPEAEPEASVCSVSSLCLLASCLCAATRCASALARAFTELTLC